MSFKSDFLALISSDLDVLLIQECEKVQRDYFEGFDFHWVGQNNKKGLGVLTRGPSKFHQEIYRSDFIYFIPAIFEDLFILGVWAFNGRAKKFGSQYSGYFLDALDHYREQIRSSKKVIVAGDFNNGPLWDIPGHKNNFVHINRALNELGLFSAYHSLNSEEFGRESAPTYFHQKRLEKSFHIDYVYSNLSSVKLVEVGTFSDWSILSDHVPLIVEFG